MAKKLKTYDPPTRSGPVPTYPWDKWLDGNILAVVPDG